MKKILIVMYLLLFSFFMNTVFAKTPFDNLNGKMIYNIGGNAIYIFDLSNNNLSILYKDDINFLSDLTKINDNKFLFVQGGSSDDTGIIMSYNRKTGKVEKVFAGVGPFYMQSTEKLFFWHKYPNDKHVFLYMADFNKLNAAPKRIGAEFNIARGGNIVQISSTEVVISSPCDDNRINSDNKVFMYDIMKNKLLLTPIKGCSNIVFWRPASQELVCYNFTNTNYFFTNLSGEHKQAPQDWNINQWSPINYIPKYDLAILQYVTPITEHSEAWLYDFATGAKKRILKHYGAVMGFYVDE